MTSPIIRIDNYFFYKVGPYVVRRNRDSTTLPETAVYFENVWYPLLDGYLFLGTDIDLSTAVTLEELGIARELDQYIVPAFRNSQFVRMAIAIGHLTEGIHEAFKRLNPMLPGSLT